MRGVSPNSASIGVASSRICATIGSVTSGKLFLISHGVKPFSSGLRAIIAAMHGFTTRSSNSSAPAGGRAVGGT